MLNLYEINKQVLRVEDNSITAIIGKSGSGKSYIIKKISEKYNIPLIKDIFYVKKKKHYEEQVLGLLKSFFKKSLLNKDNLSLEEKTILSIINNYSSNTILVDDVFSYINNTDKLKIMNFFKKNNKTVIYTTSNSEDLIYADKVIVIENGEIIQEEKTKDILKDENVFKTIGIKQSFISDLSHKLICYELIDKIYVSEKELVDALWKK